MTRYFISITLLFLAGCSAARSETAYIAPSETSAPDELTQTEKVHFLQHRLINNWVFESDGEFFFDLYNGDVSRFLDTAAEVVTPEYADEIDIRPLVNDDAVLIIFPDPEVPPQCYYALIIKNGDEYAYYTYEKTADLGESDVAGVLGGWNDEGDHLNFGPRLYRTAEAFVRDTVGDDALRAEKNRGEGTEY